MALVKLEFDYPQGTGNGKTRRSGKAQFFTLDAAKAFEAGIAEINLPPDADVDKDIDGTTVSFQIDVRPGSLSQSRLKGLLEAIELPTE